MTMARGGALTALMLLLAIGCSGSDVAAPGSGAPAEETPDGLPDAPPPPDGKPTKGIYVSASRGIEGADGTKDRPVKTLAAALALAETKESLPVIVCAETFTEAVTLKDGVTMYGYYDCNDDWALTEKHSTLVSPTSPAVLAENLVAPVRFEGFDVQAPDMTGTAPAGAAAASSYGMIVRNSKNLALAHVSIRGGKGQDGIDGVEPAPNVEQSSKAAGGPGTPHEVKSCSKIVCPSNDCFDLFNCNFDQLRFQVNKIVKDTTVSGGAGGTSNCLVKPNGGAGGAGGAGLISDDGQSRTNTSAANGWPRVANETQMAGGINGGAGQDAPAASPGATGQNGKATFTEAGFMPGDGTAGTNGSPGKGGGGGAGATGYPPPQIVYVPGGGNANLDPTKLGTWHTATGGGGGAGGCGGVAGAAGTGGGASVGLFVVGSSNMTIKQSRIEATTGGRAGKGATGTAGLPGAPGGPSIPEDKAARGGNGGKGGDAGLSGHGSAGPSIALVFNGARPVTTDVQLVAGQPGEGHPAVTSDQTRPAVSGEAMPETAF